MEEPRCQFWLPRKTRFCANIPISNSKFCGNHSTRSDDQWITCPIDPSHSVLQENLEWHVKRCPLLKRAQSLTVQPFYQQGVNAGADEEDGAKTVSPIREEVSVPSNNPVWDSSDNVSSEMKRNFVYGLSVPAFCGLIEKIKAVHRLICKDIVHSYTIKEACHMWIKGEVDRKLPFQEKHVMQQASILGNLEEYGVLRNCVREEQCGCNGSYGNDTESVPAVVEFGAGRGYLTQMLADCYGTNQVILVERKSYKLKADRSLRQKESLILERLRIDIEDLNLDGVESLRGVPYIAIGKHLCGPATDLTLRCCLGGHSKQDNIEQGSDKPRLKGLAIATCCHHLCQWKHYINKRYMLQLGITKEEFLAITWFTSWAVDADHSSDVFDVTDCLLHLQSNAKEVECGEKASRVEDVVRSMKAVERAIFGFMCKEIIDMGRLMWVKERGLQMKLVKYVPSSISPENHLLIARCENHF